VNETRINFLLRQILKDQKEEETKKHFGSNIEEMSSKISKSDPI
jgi:hypothetical protein